MILNLKMNNSIGNLTNNSLISGDIIIKLSIWSFSFLLNTLSLCILLLSKKKLIKSEFYILLSFILTTSALKLCLTGFYVAQILLPLQLNQACVQQVFFSAIISMNSLISSTLLYHTFYQISNLRRSKLFLALFNQVHNERNFFIFEFILILVLATITSANLVVASRNDPLCSNINHTLFYLVLLELIVPCSLIVVVYVSTIGFICYSRLSNQLKKMVLLMNDTNKMDQKRFRRNFKLMLKFLVFILIFILSLLPQTLYYFIFICCPNCVIDIDLFSLFSDLALILYAFQPLLLIFIHSILKRTLTECTYKCFKFILFF